jgi:hypothetical protein
VESPLVPWHPCQHRPLEVRRACRLHSRKQRRRLRKPTRGRSAQSQDVRGRPCKVQPRHHPHKNRTAAIRYQLCMRYGSAIIPMRPVTAQNRSSLRRSEIRSLMMPSGICINTLPSPIIVSSSAASPSLYPTRAPKTGKRAKPPVSTAPNTKTAIVAVGTAKMNGRKGTWSPSSKSGLSRHASSTGMVATMMIAKPT